MKLTELEGCALGLVWELGPCTPYAIRKVFQASPNPHWSGSAGAIYPVVRRLHGSELIGAQEDYTGKRRRELYRITAAGGRALRAWIGPGSHDWSATIPVDPLRIRVRFLAAMSPTARASFLVEAERELGVQVGKTEQECNSLDAKSDPYAFLMARGVLKIAQSRLEWIREVIAAVG